MTRIRLLDDHLISQIAAGEVVERPASVVKELVENSLDAGASQVDVELEVGGKRRIVVADDGVGLGKDDALLAFDRHATSKISSFDDLGHVETLGFRGEALAAIAAVSKVELQSAESPGDGHRVRIEGGRVKKVEPVAHPRGTRIEIASLFWNVPARRKFLKKPATELRRSMEVVQGYALAHPDIGFTVTHEGRALLEAPSSGEGSDALRERIAQIFGRSLADHLVAIPEVEGPEDEAIRGFVGDGKTTRGRRLFIYVNGRLVRDRAILARFYRAVRDEMKSEDTPSLFLFLDVEPSRVDVNVHPQKAEVRFRDLSFIDRVEDVLRQTLGLARGEEAAPLTEPRGRPAIPAVWEGLGGRTREGDGAERPKISTWQTAGDLREAVERPSGETLASHRPRTFLDELESDGGAPRPPAPDGRPIERIAQPSFVPMEPRLVPLSGRSGEPRPFRLLGQYKGSLILLEGPDGLYLLDQHVAHERLLYERMRRSLEAEKTVSQNLLEPVMLELAPAESMRLAELSPALEHCGFTLVPMSGQEVALTAIPTTLGLDEAESLLQALATAESSSEGADDAEVLRRNILDALAASMSCKAAVKMHHPLSPDKMERLISELFECEQPYSCPHGRPVVLTMTDAELERRFGRR